MGVMSKARRLLTAGFALLIMNFDREKPPLQPYEGKRL